MAPSTFDIGDWRALITPPEAARLAHRARTAPLYAHAYAFHLNLRFGAMTPPDLLDFAAAHHLKGVKIHVEDGESLSLRNPDTRAPFAARARALGLDLHVETSSTSAADLAEAVTIAHDIGATSVRFYPRHVGPLSQVLARTVADLAILPSLDPDNRLRFTLEQHEDLKSPELLAILRQTAHPRLSLLFDFGNMINAWETPMQALEIQAPHITEVHVKDALALPDRGGWAHRACLSDTGHLPMRAMLIRLLLLGQNHPQVTAFALEEEEDYLAPAFRFPDEGPDPVIPARGPSETDPGPGPLADRLAREAAAAQRQVQTIRAMLNDIARTADLVKG